MRTSHNGVSLGHRPKSARDWVLYAANIALWLSKLPSGSFLQVSAKRGWCYVQFALNGWSVRAEAMSNQYIVPPEYKLKEKDVQRLVAMGWQLPTKPPPELYDGAVMGGSPNYWRDFIAPVDYQLIASVAVDTLHSVYGIAQPTDLNARALTK